MKLSTFFVESSFDASCFNHHSKIRNNFTSHVLQNAINQYPTETLPQLVNFENWSISNISRTQVLLFCKANSPFSLIPLESAVVDLHWPSQGSDQTVYQGRSWSEVSHNANRGWNWWNIFTSHCPVVKTSSSQFYPEINQGIILNTIYEMNEEI